MDRTSLYRSLKPLKRKGWIEIMDKSIGPAKTVLITADGQNILEGIAPLWEAMQHTIINRFGQDAWRDLVSELLRLQSCIPDSKQDSESLFEKGG
jgi:DNA-binding PadR family transcriptional regulator